MEEEGEGDAGGDDSENNHRKTMSLGSLVGEDDDVSEPFVLIQSLKSFRCRRQTTVILSAIV